VLAALTGAGNYVLAHHSTDVQELVCRGHWKEAPSEAETAYLRLDEYPWWPKLFSQVWDGSPGPAESATVQTDKKAITEYFPDARRVFDGRLAMYSFHDFDFNTRKIGRFRGGYRAANKEVAIEFAGYGPFIGTCETDVRR
jgi:hypothetical protein